MVETEEESATRRGESGTCYLYLYIYIYNFQLHLYITYVLKIYIAVFIHTRCMYHIRR